jgi:hypothetical protein
MKLALCAIVSCSLMACGDDGGSDSADATTATDAVSSDAASSTDAAGCTQLWEVDIQQNQTASATVSNGALTLDTSNTMQGGAIEVYQTGLTGDFDVSFEFTGWTAGGTGAFAQASVAPDVSTPSEFWVAGIGTFPTVGIGAARQPTGAADLQATALTEGTITFARTGTDLTATVTTNDQTATVSGTFDAATMRVGMQLGSNMGTVATASSIQISEFTVTTGSGVTADTFDCDSLLPE